MEKMTPKLNLLFVFLILALVPVRLLSQVEVQVSTQIEEIKGEKFYIHTVEAGNTIYSISRAYNVEVHEIYKYNSGSRELLSLGQKLKIPYYDPNIALPVTDSIPLARDGFVYHKVRPGETLYRIMIRYGVKEDILIDYNPGLTHNIYPGLLIKVPEPEKIVADKSSQFYDSIFDYTIRAKETYYQYHKRYHVSQKQLEQLNPELKSTGLQEGMTIRIPYLDKQKDSLPVVVFIPEAIVPEADDTTGIIPDLAIESAASMKPS